MVHSITTATATKFGKVSHLQGDEGGVGGDVAWHDITHFFCNGIEPAHGGTMGMTSDVEWHDIAFLPSWLSAWHMRIGDRPGLDGG
jgi:hypothetical protein